MPQGDKLTPKQELFVNAYIKHWNALRAYKEAGYTIKNDNVAGVEGHRLLKNPKIHATIKQRLSNAEKRSTVTVERWLEEVAKLAFFDASDCYYTHVDEEGNTITTLKPIQYLDGTVIKEITDKGVVKGWDKAKALEMMGKYLAVFTENMNVSHSGEVNTGENNITIIQQLIESNPEIGRQLLEHVFRRNTTESVSPSQPNRV